MGKSEDPLKYTIIFGSHAVNTLYDKGIAAAKRAAKEEGMIVKKKFNTQREMEEYFNGINDMDGWEKYAVIYNDGTF